MSMPGSGAISIYQGAVELGIDATGLSLNDSRMRTLAGVGSGAISLNQFYGKSAVPPMSVTATGGNAFNDSSLNAGTVSRSCTSTVTGGVAPYTYSWTFQSSTNAPSIQSPNTANTNVTKSYSKGSNGISTATMLITVTDSAGHTATATAPVNLSWST